jgi:hypothetical protein
MENKSFGQKMMGICREGSQCQTERARVLKKKKNTFLTFKAEMLLLG